MGEVGKINEKLTPLLKLIEKTLLRGKDIS